jgi:hypothetical protein
MIEVLIDTVQSVFDEIAELPNLTPEQRDLLRADAKRLIHTMEAML